MAEHPHFGRRPLSGGETTSANRRWWDSEAADYYAEHGDFLGDCELVWGPEGWREDELAVLGPPERLRGARVLEFGAGGAQGGRWLAARGATVVSSDLSEGMIEVAKGVNRRVETGGSPIPALAVADACSLPFADASFDLAVSAYGAVPFVADSAGLMVELARVLRPGGRLVFSTTHPIRWAFPDAPGPDGLAARYSYFDRTPYVEGEGGIVTYAEHHRTLGDRVRELVAAGFVVEDLVEPEWHPQNSQTWGGWSPLRGDLLPGTVIFSARR
ncbi:class I SAM-dependent methyltransferase [Marihabitans asiaticum]|uniref:Methyltransferase family protein n=1 Tax=Marihabitans asiaticum TaxID=415218 RepID=A0A560WB85_9MICO|nr:class I SAM-dependent methyltransferase [Marihabitans asiaticum]TWD14745.1 methyltransferase family protein [Marihabitans asiaticum]